jgi:hypothetical protein
MAIDPSSASAADPYAVPKAKVEDAAPAAEGGIAYFPVSLLKLGVMCVATFNIYQIYWSYKNWKCAQRVANSDANAPIRAFFYGLTSYWLFKHIGDHAKSMDPGVSLPAGQLAFAVLALALAANLPDPYWLVTLLGFLPLLPVQTAVNRVNRQLAPDADPNARFGGWNIAGVILGGLLVALAVFGMYVEGNASPG